MQGKTNWWPKFLLALAAWSYSQYAASAAVIDEDVFDGVTYYLISPASWHDSQSEAESMGGHLAVINSMEEQEFIYNTFGPSALAAAPASGKVNMWIGLTDQDMDGELEACDDSDVTFEHFFPDQPQRNFSDEMFMGIRVRGSNDNFPVGKWIDIVSNTRLGDLSYGVVKVVTAAPEPAAWMLALAGAIGLRLVMARRSDRAG